jgi:predicted DNA-binding protein (MmcQ/YjbR family)
MTTKKTKLEERLEGIEDNIYMDKKQWIAWSEK